MTFPLLDSVWATWYLLGLSLIILEVLLSGSICLWLGVGALITGLITQVAPEFHWHYQAVLFCLFSLISFFVGRKYIKHSKPKSNASLNNRLYSYIGFKVPLEVATKNGFGKVRIHDSSWVVKGEDLVQGTLVEIIAIDNGYLVIKKVE